MKFLIKIIILLLPFLSFSNVFAEGKISLAEFIQRVQELNKDVGTERCTCESVMNSVRLMQETHATQLPEVNRRSAEGYMDKLVFNSPKFAPCFDGKKDLGPNCGICPKTSGKSALVIMDMQGLFSDRNGAIRTPSNKVLADKVIQEQIRAINQAKANNLPIMIVEYDIDTIVPYALDSNWRPFRVRANTDPRIMAAIDGYSNFQVIEKSEDSFLDPKNDKRHEVVDFFRKNEIQQIIMTGANGGACVSKSIAHALGNGCEVVSYSRGIADFNHETFIYPYAGNYEGYMAQVNAGACKGCVFREVHTLGFLTPLMRQRTSPRASTPFQNQGTVQ